MSRRSRRTTLMVLIIGLVMSKAAFAQLGACVGTPLIR